MVTMNLQKGAEKSGGAPQDVKIVEVPKPVIQEVPTVDILVARQELKIGSTLSEPLIDRQPWPSHLVMEDFIVSDGKDKEVLGMVTRSPLQAREPVMRSKLANPNDPSFLAAGLDKEMRAVTIAVDALSGVAGFVFPGDRVDVMINHRVSLGKEKMSDNRTQERTADIMEVLVPNVKVIATDQAATANASQGIKPSASVTVEVSRVDAQRLKFGESKGKLVLALRPLTSKGEEEEISRPIGMGDISRITPPSYFPILYDSSGDFAATVINPFKGGRDSRTNGAAAPSEEKKKEISQAIKSAQAASQDDAPAAESKAPASSNILIIRGVQKENMEVKQP
jgi:pilus assembly protein CpaB